MVPNLDMYRAANILVKQHGQDAPIHAAMRADAMLEAGDLDGLRGVEAGAAGGGRATGGGA